MGFNQREHETILQSGAQNKSACLTLRNPASQKPALPKTIFGNFLEHLGFAIQGGVSAQILSNPTFSRETNLLASQVADLLRAGDRLTSYFRNPDSIRDVPLNWTPGTEVTGFGVAALDDCTALGIPFPWSPIGAAGGMNASVGRLGGAIRLNGSCWQGKQFPAVVSLDEGPVGIRQGVFIPFTRCHDYEGDLMVRIATLDPASKGEIEVGIRRRLGSTNGSAGEVLASQRLKVVGREWKKAPFKLQIISNKIGEYEPLDFYLRWLPLGNQRCDLLVDRAFFFPMDAVEGFDPDVLSLTKNWPVPLLRWPGGNFVSQYHWRDGVGPLDFRPTRMNYAWYGLEYNFFGTSEFIHYCKLIGAEPQITVNTATGTAEEAAAWVEFCNGDASTPMGKMRADQGDPDPYNVRLWEVGNEMYGCWQIGYCGSDENARRYSEFARTMKKVDPSIQLIATGNSFDFAEPGPAYDYTHADKRWHQKLIDLAGADLEIISLHSLPVNDRFLDHLENDEAYYSLLAQPVSWERKFLPELIKNLDQSLPHQKPVQLAITEWGILGTRKDRPYVDSYGEALYAAEFLNMMIRNSERIPIANATALLHGGCIRKVAGQTYTDAQYLVIQKYSEMIGGHPMVCEMQSPKIDSKVGTDLGIANETIPLIDAVACLSEGNKPKVLLALVNISLDQTIHTTVNLPALTLVSPGEGVILSGKDPVEKATFDHPQPFPVRKFVVDCKQNKFDLELPPVSICWVNFSTKS